MSQDHENNLENITEEEPTSWKRKIVPILLVCFAGILWGVSEIAVKKSCIDKDNGHVFIILMFRGAFQSVVTFIACLTYLGTLRPGAKDSFRVFVRAFCESVNCISIYAALLFITPLEVTLTSAIKPFFVLVVSFIWLKEAITKLNLLLITLVIIGVFFVCKPIEIFNNGFNSASSLDQLSGIGLVFVSNISATIYICCCRKLQSSHTLIILFWLSIMSLVTSSILGAIFADFKEIDFRVDIAYSAFIAFCVMFAEGLLTHSLKKVNATEIAIALNTQIPTTLVLQWVLFELIPTWQVSLGGSIIIACVIINLFQDHIIVLVDRLKNNQI